MVQVKKIVVDSRKVEVYYGDKRINLPPAEFKLIEALYNAQGAMLSYSILAEHVGFSGKSNGQRPAMAQLVSRLRARLDGSLIETVTKFGYKMPSEHRG